MRPTWPEVAVVAVVLLSAIVGGCLKALSPELVAALVTAAVSYFAWRSRERGKPDNGAVPEAVARTPSAKIVVDKDGRVVVEPASQSAEEERDGSDK